MSTATISSPAALPANSSAAPSTSPLDFAVQQILAKQRKQAILSQLTTRWNLSNETALLVVNRAYTLKHAAFRKAGVKTLFIGLAMAVIGALITGATYSMASNGGTYVVTYGLIIMGIVKMIQGLFMVIVG